ncbi:uncharacterized protein METZ01_LOCUS482217, partial [marine metagenome]
MRDFGVGGEVGPEDAFLDGLVGDGSALGGEWGGLAWAEIFGEVC